MLLLLALSALGLIVLALAADHLVLGSGRLAERLGLQPVVVGVVVIGFGTSAPELVVTGTASLRGQTDLALAGLVGSNIVNLTLILGVTGLVAALAVEAGLSPDLVGFTLVALGTSLPELVTCLQAQRRGDSDLVVGNLLGSNLINSLAGGAVIAVAGTTAPAMAPAVIAAMAGVSGLTWALLARGKRLSRRESLLLLVLYAALLPLVT
ncbi:sodium:calcium antiporter [Nonomuraea gerenzanensis]|uniref:Inner membrane protein YrbG, predicted calcium/sodium:proton antiporter n=1 Tax=Nonomuraea gerenzanensis TaxID=93944 RepID=A0A1M4EBI1_9ACTN|nr:hypothetical protein [Nonomuraea gerenzanensis]UBU18424.1 hypothetical protein LCN96_26390 [Nonomuraea gerenzanensis]SBO96255.1 Inner membrane protein YrbG, predicted calcium/sodium:proton antiporter [Nonomuraea gerenzanensis]